MVYRINGSGNRWIYIQVRERGAVDQPTPITSRPAFQSYSDGTRERREGGERGREREREREYGKLVELSYYISQNESISRPVPVVVGTAYTQFLSLGLRYVRVPENVNSKVGLRERSDEALRLLLAIVECAVNAHWYMHHGERQRS